MAPEMSINLGQSGRLSVTVDPDRNLAITVVTEKPDLQIGVSVVTNIENSSWVRMSCSAFFVQTFIVQ